MNRVLCLRFENWPVQRIQRVRPAEAGASVAVHTVAGSGDSADDTPAGLEDRRFVRALFASAKGGPAIVASSREAWLQGVRPGMPLAEARSMIAPCSSGLDRRTSLSPRSSQPAAAAVETAFFEWSPEADRAALAEAAELTRSYAPIVGRDNFSMPDSLLLDVTACGPLFGGESQLAERLLRDLQKHGYTARAAIADCVSVAWALTHPDGHLLQEYPVWGRRPQRRMGPDLPAAPVVILPPGQSAAAVRQLPIAAARIPPADVDILQQLGILLCGQLLNLPVEDLPSRLSALCIERIRQLSEVSKELIDALPERHPIAARWSSEFPLTSLAEIQQVLRQLTEEVSPRLIRRHIGATRMTCRFRAEDGAETVLTAESVTPLQDPEALYDIVRLSLERTPFRDPLLAAEVTVTTCPLPATRQKDLFQTDGCVRPVEELAYTLNRLTNRLGPAAVRTIDEQASAVPEQAVFFRPFRADQGPKSVTGRLDDLVLPDESVRPDHVRVRRPLRLLSTPLRLNLSSLRQPQGEFVFHHELHRVRGVAGPERIQTEWWQGHAVNRDYYRVRTDRQATFWVFEDRLSGQWYLHGVFD